MKLTTAQLSAAARGVAYVTQEEGRVRLHRFTAAQEELYRPTNVEHYDRTFATAGVALEFDTDSTALRLAVRCRKGSSRHWFVHSIFVNGRRIGELRGKFTPPETADAEASWQLGDGTKRVKILFPWSAGSEVCALELDDGASFMPVKPEKTVLIYGDSITHGAVGHDIDYDAVYWNLLHKKLNSFRHYVPVNMINAGIGGLTATASLPRLQRDVLCHHPDLIVVCFGLNDAVFELQDYISSLQTIFRQCRSSGADVIFMTPNMFNTYVAEDTLPELLEDAAMTAEIQNSGKMDRFMEAARMVAAEFEIPVCDCYAVWKQMYAVSVNWTVRLK